jgi:hypothetical protein
MRAPALGLQRNGTGPRSDDVITLRPMRRLLILGLFLALAPPAHAAPNVSIAPSGVVGQAPFTVTLSAVGAADTYS